MRISAKKLWSDGVWLTDRTVVINGGIITDITEDLTGDILTDYLTPGLIDNHIHGGDGISVIDADADEICDWLVKLAESGKSLYKMDAPKADTQSGTFRDVVGHKNQKAIEALAEKGVINGEAKKTDPGKMVSTFLMGSKAVYDFIDDNPGVLMMDVGYTNDPFIIAKNDRVTAINSALQVDITGQVCADSLGTKFYSGVGGQIDFIYGASLSKGGKAIIAMPSVTNKGISKIAPELTCGAGVVTTRNHIHWFVTENGAVNLYGKSLQERARLIISIADPSAQESLDRAAFERYGQHHHYVKNYMGK